MPKAELVLDYVRIGDVWLRRDAIVSWVQSKAGDGKAAVTARVGGVDWRLNVDFEEFTKLMLTPRKT